MNNIEIAAALHEYAPGVKYTEHEAAIFAAGVQVGEARARETLSATMMNAWHETHNGRMPWKTAVEISAVITGMGEEERQRLLSLG